MTWLELLWEKLPDSMFAKEHDMLPAECPHGFFGGSAPDFQRACDCKTTCTECWNSEAEAQTNDVD